MKQKIKKFTKRVTESICGTGAFMVFNGISDDFCAQLCSEEKVVETSKNGTYSTKIDIFAKE